VGGREGNVFLRSVHRLLVKANVVPSSPILVTLMMGCDVPPERRFLQEPHGVTSKKTAFVNVGSFESKLAEATGG
jgi:hypothetical protein